MRRVVTGIDRDGKSVFVSDGEPPRNFKAETGQEIYEVWRTYGTPTIPVDQTDPTVEMTTCLPEVGENGSFLRFIYYPGTRAIEQAVKNGVDLEAIEKRRQEYQGVNPATGKPFFAAERLKSDSAMHSTDTIDYAIVVSGEIWMEMDDGAEVHLKQGDVVIQNGTRHAWRQRSPEPCIMAFCMLGVNNKYRQHFQDR
jgi:mannose-6-phosphate isomerase-like protein (cupin superfamily)